MSHGEIQELLGAYALGAVDEQERGLIEAHLETCESCRVELEDHRRLAEALRRHASRVSPLASIESNGSAKTSEAGPRARPVRRWGLPVALAILVVVMGGLFGQGQIHSSDLEARMVRIELLERAQLAATDPAAIVATLRTPRNEPVLTVVGRAVGGDSYAMNSALPRLAGGQAYKLWRLDDRGLTPAVSLGRRPETVAFTLPSGVTGFILTVEKGPAPSRPTLPAIASVRISQ